MEELIVSSEELKQLFQEKRMLDTDKGWFLDDEEVHIYALHKQEPKYISDITNAEFYKLVKKDKGR
jgi:predicted methyltransferase